MPSFIKSCCFCLPMRTGVMMLGFLSLLYSMSIIIASIVRLSDGEIKGFWAGYVIVGVASSVMSVILIIGVFKDKPMFLVVYYWWLGLSTLATGALATYVIVVISQAGQTEVLTTIGAIILVLSTVLNIYFIIIVRQYSKTIKKKLASMGIPVYS